MFRRTVTTFCIFIYVAGVFTQTDFIRSIFEKENLNITRVRTPDLLKSDPHKFIVLDFIGLVQQYKGYTAEEYEVHTDDGYILLLHRVTGSPNSPKATGKPVIYLQHGILGTSDFSVLLGSRLSLPFVLADAGYDIWLGNSRGSSYSKRHVHYSSEGSNKDFWDFGPHDCAIMDTTKFIDFTLEKTEQKQLTYIGYSMGTTLSYILLSTKPEYNEKMNLVISLSPVGYIVAPFSDVVNTLLASTPSLVALGKQLQIYEILPQSKLNQIIGNDVCRGPLGRTVCQFFLPALLNTNNFNFTALPTMAKYTPAGTSLKVIHHYYQITATGNFQNYDYGYRGNEEKYGSSDPPTYDMSKITAPQAIFYSDSDAYISVKSAKATMTSLRNVVAFEKVNASGFNHLDYMLANNAREAVYEKMLPIIAKFT